MAQTFGISQATLDRWSKGDKYSRGLHIRAVAGITYACDGVFIAALADGVTLTTAYPDPIDFSEYITGTRLIGKAIPVYMLDNDSERTRFVAGKQRVCIWLQIDGGRMRYTVPEWALKLLSRTWRGLELQIRESATPTKTKLLHVLQDDRVLGSIYAMPESASPTVIPNTTAPEQPEPPRERHPPRIAFVPKVDASIGPKRF